MHHSFRIDHLDTLKNIFHLSTIGTCIHGNCAADASRNSCCKFHSAKACCHCLIRYFREQCARSCHNLCAFYTDIIHSASYLNDKATDSLISYKKIASVTNHSNFCIFFFCCFKQSRQLLLIRAGIYFCRTTDTKCCMLRHQFFFHQPHFRETSKYFIK